MIDNSVLFPVDFANLPATQLGSDADFDNLVKCVEILCRLQLFSKGLAINRKSISPGHWGIPEDDDEITDLGKSVGKGLL